MAASVEESLAVDEAPQPVPNPALHSQDSQTASDFINSQLQLEADAREVLPYAFDSCSQALGPLRQSIFACTTCNPPPASPAQLYTPAGICYSCSIACHGDHTLVELFSRRNFVCDCGSTRMPDTSPCTLRRDPLVDTKGARSQEAAKGNHYNHNFQNRFCGCGEEYDAYREKGTMYQCLGLGTVESGGCGEDWWHPECLMGLPRDWRKRSQSAADPLAVEQGAHSTEDAPESGEDDPSPPGFPNEDDFETLLCYKCVESNPWIKQYAGAPGFLPPLFKRDQSSAAGVEVDHAGIEDNNTIAETESKVSGSRKRKSSEESDSRLTDAPKRIKNSPTSVFQEDIPGTDDTESAKPHLKHELLPPAPPSGTFSLFLKEDFREHICHCPQCYPNLIPHPQLVEEEDTYEPPVSESGSPGSAAHSQGTGTGSLLERGEAALSTVDRVRALEGVMVYNKLKDKVKQFLKPYAESGQAVGAEDIKTYFEKLRGDDAAIRDAGGKPGIGGGGGGGGVGGDDNKENDGGDGTDYRREQSGY